MFKTLKKYWSSYGGLSALFKSPFFWLSLIVTALSYDFFIEKKWSDLPASMLPTLLGFNIASYSVWLAFGNHKLNRILSKLKDGQIHSRYMEVHSSFIHFILVQILCLILVVFLKTNSLDKIIYLSNLACLNIYMNVLQYMGVFINGFIFFLFCYGLFIMLATVLGFIGIAAGLDVIHRQESNEEKVEKQLLKKNMIADGEQRQLLNRISCEELELLEIKKAKAKLELQMIQKANNELEWLVVNKTTKNKEIKKKIKNILQFYLSNK